MTDLLPVFTRKLDFENYNIKETYNMQELRSFYKDVISCYTESDCWALTVNDEILWNSYKPDRSYKEIVEENITRQLIINNPHHVFVNVLLRNIDTTIIIYMFQYNSFGIHIEYKASDECYHVKIIK